MDDSSSENVSLTPVPAGAVKVYLVQAKLDPQNIAELFSLAHSFRDAHGASTLVLCQNAAEADIVVTNVHMRKRLERHVSWDLAKAKAIVTPQWLRDSVKQHTILPCGEYAALRELKETTVEHCPDDSEPDGKFQDDADAMQIDQVVEKAHYTSRYACLRACPLECLNQGLVQQLGTIRRSRELEGEDINALSYERAISVIKGQLPEYECSSPQLELAYPYTLTSWRLAEIAKLPGIGEKMLSKITEYVNYGTIKESQTIAASARFRALLDFTMIYGIGATTARKLYDSFGLRTLDDLAEHYNNHLPPTLRHGNKSRVNTRAPTLSIKDALVLSPDLNEKIPRAEVDMMHSVVMAELEQVLPGCVSTVVGGYRRGKTESNDVDIVITHPTLASGSNQVVGLCETLINRLYKRGAITHVMHLSDFHPPDTFRTANWDTLEKALTVFVLPPDVQTNHSRRIHRRLDLIFAAPETYWTAVVGWTGSKMFERDLRLWAKERGMKFDSTGIVRRRDSKQYFPRSEEEVFSILGLECIPPNLRNADA